MRVGERVNISPKKRGSTVRCGQARASSSYAGRTGLTRTESVRQAQLDMIAGKAGAPFRRPAFRAPYALIGDAAK
jgi:hypothetical protein